MLKHPTNLEFHEMSLSDWLRALPADHIARQQFIQIIVTLDVAMAYLADSTEGVTDYLLQATADKILETYENVIRNP